MTILDKLEALHKAAMPGPWPADVWYGTDGGWAAVAPLREADGDEGNDEPGSPANQHAEADAAYLAAMHSMLPALLRVARAANQIASSRHHAGELTARRIADWQSLDLAIAPLLDECDG